MDAGFLNKYFSAVAAKHLSAVEADSEVSDQHEYNGVSLLKKMFGTDTPKKIIPTAFLYLSDDDDAIEAEGSLTWYDARYHNPNRTEWRLYYPTNDVTSRAEKGDTLFICLRRDNTVLDIVTKKESIIENQLFWLFNIRPDENSNSFVANTDLTNPPSAKVDFAARMILQKIGVEIPQTEEDFTGLLIDRFGYSFPTTKEFSEFSRSTISGADPVGDPDGTLVLWYDREETLFMNMEKIIIQERLRKGFTDGENVDVDGFIAFSLSVNNRRKSRAGLSFENNLEAIFRANNIRYSHTPVTENRSKPDFIFPSIEMYRDESYPAEKLTMLGAKTTAKDRWRQVLEEADRIEKKHLITLEAAISEYQTDEMISRNLQLVVPQSIQSTFTVKQQSWLFSVRDFLHLVEDRQNFYGSVTFSV